MRYKMPEIDLDKVTYNDATERQIAERIVIRNGKGNDATTRLRASQPPLDDDTGREASYVWRMVAFFISPNQKHGCMPVTAEFKLPRKYWAGAIGDSDTIRACAEARKARVEELDGLVDRITDTCLADLLNPRSGFRRWAKVLT